MVKITNYRFIRTMSSFKYKTIRDKKQYQIKAKKGLFKYLQVKEKKLRHKNFIIKYFKDYKNLYYFIKYKSYKDIELDFQMPLSEALARAFVNNAKRRGDIE